MSRKVRDLGDGLILRTAGPEDTEELAAFNARNHSDDPEKPATGLEVWTRDLVSGRHPFMTGDDITVVADERDGGKIVSTAILVSQRWRYEDVEFPVGRPELIATEPAYRRRGLVRHQMEVLHEWSAARGEIVQAITGIPWYYRKFGYEMTLDLGGGRRFYWAKEGNLAEVEEEKYTLRPAVADDAPLVSELYAVHARSSMITAVRDEAFLAWEIEGQSRESEVARRFHIVTTPAGDPVGYVGWRPNPPLAWIREIAVRPGVSLRAVALFVTRELKRILTAEPTEAKKPVTHLAFALGREHPVYDALRKQLEEPYPPYSWYIRVPDLRAFLLHIRPVLERRLANSVMAGHTGDLRLNFYTDRMKMVFRDGRFEGLEDWEPKRLEDGDVMLPDLTFLKLVFGARTEGELRHARADCYPMNYEARILVDILFPKRASQVLALA